MISCSVNLVFRSSEIAASAPPDHGKAAAGRCCCRSSSSKLAISTGDTPNNWRALKFFRPAWAAREQPRGLRGPRSQQPAPAVFGARGCCCGSPLHARLQLAAADRRYGLALQPAAAAVSPLQLAAASASPPQPLRRRSSPLLPRAATAAAAAAARR